MSRIEKILSRFYSSPKDFTWEELVQVLKNRGYEEMAKGQTGGSRRKFANARKQIIILHKPHPQNTVREYALKQLIEAMEIHKKAIDSKHVEKKAGPPRRIMRNKKK